MHAKQTIFLSPQKYKSNRKFIGKKKREKILKHVNLHSNTIYKKWSFLLRAFKGNILSSFTHVNGTYIYAHKRSFTLCGIKKINTRNFMWFGLKIYCLHSWSSNCYILLLFLMTRLVWGMNIPLGKSMVITGNEEEWNEIIIQIP
jgi:hypothetical protein